MEILTKNEHDAILRNMENLLSEYNYIYSEDALNTIIDTWAEQKQDLLSAFKRHPNYVENEFCIAFSSDYERTLDSGESCRFSNWIQNSIADVYNNLPENIAEYRCTSETIPWPMYDIITSLRAYAARTLSEVAVSDFSAAFPMLHFHKGEKTSRAVNRICDYLGYTKLPEYNQKFAKYADSLSPLVIKRHTVLSINPLDYLTMSFGNSWASCHTIDKHNQRGMPDSYSGMYSSGTMSYMLDGTSMVFYTTYKNNPAQDYWTQPKINRQMFHWGEEKLIQGRLYPQDNDGNSEAYTPYRNIVQKILSEIFQFPNLWRTTKGTDEAEKYIWSEGTHYRDYENFDNCTLSRVLGSENTRCITVGHTPICVECGCSHSEQDTINCCHNQCIICARCGEFIDLDDLSDYAEKIDGVYYCHDCCSYCDCCDTWYVGKTTEVNGYGHVCEACLHSGAFTQCDECGEWFANRRVTYIDSTEHYVCRSCRIHYYIKCDKCGEWFYADDTVSLNNEYLCSKCAAERMAKLEESEENEACGILSTSAS